VLTPDPGWGIRLISFQMGGWNIQPPVLGIYVRDGQGNNLADYSGTHIAAPFTPANTFTPNVASNGPISIYWGNSWHIALDNVVFEEFQISRVPEPGSWALALAGLAIVTRLGPAARRVRRRGPSGG